MSAVSNATSLPAAPIAIPTVLFAIAGASFTPSPTIATLDSCSFNFLMASTFSSGNRLPQASVNPISLATASATFWLSPVSIIIRLIPISFNFFSVSLAASRGVSIRAMIPIYSLFLLISIVVFPPPSSSFTLFDISSDGFASSRSSYKSRFPI